jgi:hypothetical protein
MPSKACGIAGLTCIIVMTLVGPANADPNDTVGRLDIHRVRGERKATDVAKLRIVTFGSWGKALLAREGRNRIWIHLDTNADAGVDHRTVIYERNGRLLMASSGKGAEFRRIPVRHPSRRTAVVAVQGDSRINPDRAWRFYATSRYVSDTRLCSTGCRDRAPDSRWVKVEATSGG